MIPQSLDILRRELSWQEKASGLAQAYERWLGASPAGAENDSRLTDEAATDWTRILSCYDRLVKLNNSPVVALHRAVAVARVHGPQAGLDALGAISSRGSLESYHLFHAVCGTFAVELHRFDEALTHFRKAEALTTVSAEREFLAHRIRECGGAHPV